MLPLKVAEFTSFANKTGVVYQNGRRSLCLTVRGNHATGSFQVGTTRSRSLV